MKFLRLHEIVNGSLMLMLGVLHESIISLSVASHHVDFSYFETESHMTNFASLKLLKLSASFLDS